jgi:hypothetical protein
MSAPSPIRALLIAAFALPALAQGIPPTAQTTPAPAAAAQAAATPASQPAHRAEVGFSTGMLSIEADNSSLNQILREISRLTGMKITGGVNEERVYGTYGPADTSTVLSALLRGTGSNMLLIFDENRAPQELVLTPRGGGATPPNPSASRERDEEDLPPQRRPRFPGAPANEPARAVPQPAPPPAPRMPAPAQLEPQPVAAPAVPAADTTTQSDPNAVKTPQQIYEQLMKMQQQQKTSVQAPPQ